VKTGSIITNRTSHRGGRRRKAAGPTSSAGAARTATCQIDARRARLLLALRFCVGILRRDELALQKKPGTLRQKAARPPAKPIATWINPPAVSTPNCNSLPNLRLSDHAVARWANSPQPEEEGTVLCGGIEGQGLGESVVPPAALPLGGGLKPKRMTAQRAAQKLGLSNPRSPPDPLITTNGCRLLLQLHFYEC
jgi:hypothetical protein